MSDTSAQSTNDTPRFTQAKLVQNSGTISAISPTNNSLFTITSRRSGSVAIRFTPRDSKPEIDTAK